MIHPYWYILFTVLLAALPMVATVGTAYVKVSIVLGALRNAFGVQGFPGPILTSSLALVLSVMVLAPIAEKIVLELPRLTPTDLAQQPTEDTLKKLAQAFEPWIAFMERHSGEHETQAVVELMMHNEASSVREVSEEKSHPWHLTLVAFLLSEMRAGFVLAFGVLLPFIVIDLIVANVLVGLGMMMVSPTTISLPLKLFVFIAADGWIVLTQSLFHSYQT